MHVYPEELVTDTKNGTCPDSPGTVVHPSCKAATPGERAGAWDIAVFAKPLRGRVEKQ